MARNFVNGFIFGDKDVLKSRKRIFGHGFDGLNGLFRTLRKDSVLSVLSVSKKVLQSELRKAYFGDYSPVIAI